MEKFFWSNFAFGANNTVAPTMTTTYTVTVTDANLCQNSASVTVNVATPGTDVCNVIYVSPGANGAGTQLDPADLITAIGMANCNDMIIKMDQGTYNIDNAITNILGNITLEGGFNSGNNWRKSSAAGLTTINRTALNPVGSANQQRISAFEIADASEFRFQDLTITTDDAVGDGVSAYGIHLSNCSDYDIVRVQVLTGDGSTGATGSDGATGTDGQAGSAGTNGNDDIQAFAGVGGDGGAGGGAGAGTGGTGGADPNSAFSCCSNFANQGGESRACCLDGNDGADGLASANTRAGGGGGGGGSGGEAENQGGRGGRAGGVNGGISFAVGGLGGNGDGGCSNQSGNPGNDGFQGSDGGNGGMGTVGPGGNDNLVSGFWEPGTAAGQGDDGEGGEGGGGGGGGGGEGCGICCNDGAGSGGGGGGGGGEGGEGGEGGLGGGGSFGIYIHANGANGSIRDCFVQAGNGGAGGVGGNGGAGGNGGDGGLGNTYGVGNNVGPGGDGSDGGDGGDGGQGGTGAAGINLDVHLSSGVALADNDAAFALGSQPPIQMTNISCTNQSVTYISPSVSVWDLGAGATNPTPAGLNVNSEYITTGRKTISFGAFTYDGFANIILDNNAVPDASTTAPQIGGQYRICAGSSVDFAALNGATGYIYNWDLDGGAIPNTYVGTTFESINNIAFNTPGTYFIELRYETDCCGLSDPDTVELIVEEQPVTLVSGPADFCAGSGGVELNASGATTYNWTPATGLSAVSGDVIQANPAANQTYTITGYNASGMCFSSTTATVNVNDINLTASSVDQGCTPDGQASVVVSGAVGVPTYVWNTTPAQTTATATGLASGTYQVNVTDPSTGCTDSAAVFVDVAPGSLSSFVASTTPVSCNGGTNGSMSVQVSGGSGTYQYNWASSASTTNTATGLSAGNQTVTITDMVTSCQTTVNAFLTEPSPLQLAVLSQTNADCNTFGAAQVNASGGNGPYTYTWNTVPSQSGSSIDSLTNGTYNVVVTDEDGCNENVNVVIPGTQSPVIISLVDSSAASSCQASDGSIEVSGIGSGGNITYTWSNAQTGPIATGLGPGPYTVTAVGSNGCSDVFPLTLGPVCPLSTDDLWFDARPADGFILLDWKTNVEEDLEGFWLERSIDGEHFVELGWTDAAGSTINGANYQWEDHTVKYQENYIYRLRLVDLDGSIAYSVLREAMLEIENAISIRNLYPIPTRDIVFVEIVVPEALRIQMDFVNSLGQRLRPQSFETKAGLNVLRIDLSGLAEGMYIGRVMTAGRHIESLKLIKSN
ncbi:MAG: hypothetical protein AAF206_17250 [Bacteroidota bacterium]